MTTSLHKIPIYAGLVFIAYFLLATFVPYLAGNSGLNAQDADFYIKPPASDGTQSRPAVYFSHDKHMDSYDCLDCHHDYKNGENVLDEDDIEDGKSTICASCHTKGASIDLETAFHRECMGCHRRVNKQEETSLPITCQDCHNRRPHTP